MDYRNARQSWYYLEDQWACKQDEVHVKRKGELWHYQTYIVDDSESEYEEDIQSYFLLTVTHMDKEQEILPNIFPSNRILYANRNVLTFTIL